jgi:hypothetical protein
LYVNGNLGIDYLFSYDAALECFRLTNTATLSVKCLSSLTPLVLTNSHIDLLNATTAAQAEQTTSTPEPETPQAAVTPESSYVAPVSSYEAPSFTLHVTSASDSTTT